MAGASRLSPGSVTIPARPGANELEIKVINLWCNRVIGDASLPPGQRRTRTSITNLTGNTPLAPSGMLGPVRLMRANSPEP